MRMYNLDGSEGMMCGNGIRCVAKYVYDSGIAKKDVLHIETKSGIKICRVHVENGEVTTVTVDMGEAALVPAKIPVDFPGDTAVKEEITVLDKEYEVTCVSMGNPHCVVFCRPRGRGGCRKPSARSSKTRISSPSASTPSSCAWSTAARSRCACGSAATAKRIACGTGACASAAGAAVPLRPLQEGRGHRGQAAPAGDLVINCTDAGVQMTGSADTVFTGIVEI